MSRLKKEFITNTGFGFLLLTLSVPLGIFFDAVMQGDKRLLPISVIVLAGLHILEVIGMTFKFPVIFTTKNRFFGFQYDDNAPPTFGQIAFFLYIAETGFLPGAAAIFFSGRDNIVPVVTVIVLITLKWVYYLLLATGPLFQPVKKPSAFQQRFGNGALWLFIYVNYGFISYLAILFARSIGFGGSPWHILCSFPVMMAIFLPLRFPFLFERSLKIAVSRERLLFYLSLSWIGLAASLNLYLAA
ncbi:MAG TPA: hypothetical protein PLO63_16005 [Syntrophales bacterium]|jgi:hypothetical protein|nr:hypothetical protein [Syntrophales bacterium]